MVRCKYSFTKILFIVFTSFRFVLFQPSFTACLSFRYNRIPDILPWKLIASFFWSIPVMICWLIPCLPPCGACFLEYCIDVFKFESLQNDVSRAQSADSSKAYWKIFWLSPRAIWLFYTLVLMLLNNKSIFLIILIKPVFTIHSAVTPIMTMFVDQNYVIGLYHLRVSSLRWRPF